MRSQGVAGPRSVGQHHGDLRRALVEATVALLEEGHHAPSLRQAARRAGVSPGAPYHHFGSRDGLMAAVAEAGFEALEEAQTRALAGETSAGPRLAAMTRAYVRFALEHPAHYEVLFAPRDGDEEPPESLRIIAFAAFERLVKAVADCRPDLDGPRLRSRARSVWGTAHGGVVLARMQAFERLGDEMTVDSVADEVSAAVLRDVGG